jgi:hypothetical protein
MRAWTLKPEALKAEKIRRTKLLLPRLPVTNTRLAFLRFVKALVRIMA